MWKATNEQKSHLQFFKLVVPTHRDELLKRFLCLG